MVAVGWDLVNRRVVEVTSDKNLTIRCSCRVVNKLWLGAGGSCHILNLQTLKIEVNNITPYCNLQGLNFFEFSSCHKRYNVNITPQ